MNESSGILWPGDYGTRSAPAPAGRAIALSLAVHLMVAALAITGPFLWQGGPRVDLSNVFVVSLVPSVPAPHAHQGARAKPKASEPEAPAPKAPQPKAPEAAAKKSSADARMVAEPVKKPAPKHPEPKAKSKEAPPEKALAKEKVAPAPSAAAREAKLAQALDHIRNRVEREAALDAAIAQVRRQVAAQEADSDEDGVIAAGQFEGNVPLSFRLYYEEVWKRVKENWALPQLSQHNLVAVVTVRIARDGAIERAQIESSSGDRRFDHSALNAVRAANPLPPLPGDYLGRWHEIGIRFHQ